MDHINNDKRPWYVCHTKPKQEFRAAENLDRQGYQIWLPQMRAWQRKKSVLIPMFPRYMFLRPAHEQHSIAPVRSTLGVFGLVRFGTEPATIRDPTLQSLRALEEKLRAAEFASFSPFKQGDQVLIVDGPFKGLEGIVSKVAEERVSVLMTLLGRERSLDFPAALLKVS
jgi:transcriptional antiterminator RfaH